MRLTDLLDSTLVDRTGEEIGHVSDVWLAQDGPPIGPFGAALRVHRLVHGEFGIGSRLGYQRPDVNGPAPAAWFFRRHHGDRSVAPWDDVAAIEPGRIRLRCTASELERPASIDHHDQGVAGRTLSAGLDVLDRQLVDPVGMMAGKVDDLEITPSENGPPVVTAILAGPGALARRLGGHLGTWLASVQERLRPEDRDGPARIGFGVVASIDDHVTLTVSREDLDTFEFEAWVRDRFISKIPGSG